jgi:hypothetical protein
MLQKDKFAKNNFKTKLVLLKDLKKCDIINNNEDNKISTGEHI